MKAHKANQKKGCKASVTVMRAFGERGNSQAVIDLAFFR